MFGDALYVGIFFGFFILSGLYVLFLESERK